MQFVTVVGFGLVRYDEDFGQDGVGGVLHVVVELASRFEFLKFSASRTDHEVHDVECHAHNESVAQRADGHADEAVYPSEFDSGEEFCEQRS